MLNRATCFALLAAALLMASAPPAGAQGAGNNCDISGTWYGGSDPHYPYLVTIAPIAAGRYQFVAQFALDLPSIGYVGATNWLGEVTKTGGQTYDIHAMSYLAWDPETAPPELDSSLPEMDIVRSHVKFNDCNTFTNTVDVYGAYLSFDFDRTTPFVTPPDMDWLGGGKIEETYHRMPTACPSCPFPSAAKAVKRRR